MNIQNKELPLPIIQGGMGVGISLSRLAGNVAKCGGMGVISSVNAGYAQADFLTNPVEANLRALSWHIREAKRIADGNGLIAVNVMTAVSNYEQTVQTAVEAGADAIISGAGLPLKLPTLVAGKDTLFAPIVSSGKAAALLCRSYSKKNHVIPDFMILEGYLAGGHLGFSSQELIEGTAGSNEKLLEEVLQAIEPFEREYGKKIPVFVAGGIFDGADMAHFMKRGAAGVQIATRFIATEECDASPVMKQAIVNATIGDIRIIKSPVGMPARALNSPLLERLEKGETFYAKVCNACLSACPKGTKPPYCISRALIEAVKGNWEDGLFFCGENAYRVDKIMTVQALMDELVEEWRANR